MNGVQTKASRGWSPREGESSIALDGGDSLPARVWVWGAQAEGRFPLGAASEQGMGKLRPRGLGLALLAPLSPDTPQDL